MFSPLFGGRSWTGSDGYNGHMSICLNESSCSTSNLSIAFDSLIEYDHVGVEGSYNFSFGGLSTELNVDYSSAASGGCGEMADCTGLGSAAELPSGGYALPSSIPTASGAPVLQRSVTYVEEGELYSLPIRIKEYSMPSTLRQGDFFFVCEFDGWNLGSADSTLNLTLRFNTVIDGINENTAVWGESATTSYSRLNLGNGINIFLANTYTNQDLTTEYVGISYSVADESVEVEIAFPPSTWFEYSYALQFDTHNLSTGTLSSGSTSVPLPIVHLYPGGFEYCATETCNPNLNFLGFSIDRIGVYPTYNSSRLWYAPVVADFTLEDSLLFAPTIEQSKHAAHSLILEVSKDSSIRSSNNLNILTNGPDNSDTIVTALTVTLLEDNDNITINNGEIIDAPAGALKVRINGFTPSGSLLSSGSVGLSFFLFSMYPLDNKWAVETSDSYSSTYTTFSMYMKIPKYGEVDNSISQIQSEVLQIGQDMQLLLTLPPISSNFSLEFFIGFDYIEYGNSSLSSSTVENVLRMGDSHGPTKNLKGEDVPTKLLLLPRGQFGLCFDATCTTTVVKLEFSGLESSEGVRFNRFANAAAFAFSEPQYFDYTPFDMWTSSFSTLVPQSRVRPPIPYDSRLESSYMMFSVGVTQYLAPGFTGYSSSRTMLVPRGALRFTFFIWNWKPESDTDKLTLNITLSSIIGPTPGSTKFTVNKNHDTMHLMFDSENFLDITLLTEIDSRETRVSVTPVFESDIGIVLMMTFGKFSNLVVHNSVMASESLAAMDNRLVRSPASYTVAETSGIVLAVILGVMIAMSVVRCARKLPIKIDFSKFVL